MFCSVYQQKQWLALREQNSPVTSTADIFLLPKPNTEWFKTVSLDWSTTRIEELLWSSRHGGWTGIPSLTSSPSSSTTPRAGQENQGSLWAPWSDFQAAGWRLPARRGKRVHNGAPPPRPGHPCLLVLYHSLGPTSRNHLFSLLKRISPRQRSGSARGVTN